MYVLRRLCILLCAIALTATACTSDEPAEETAGDDGVTEVAATESGTTADATESATAGASEAGAGADETDTTSIDAACEAGAEEPRLVWYSSQDPSRNDAAIAAFSEAHPEIEVEGLRLATGALAARYAEERAAGVVNADLISLADPIFINEGFGEGWFVEFEKGDLPGLDALEDRWFDRGAATTSISLLGIAYNTDLMADNPPETWEDLLDPELQGEIILGDPRNVPSYLALARLWRDEIGPEFLEQLAAQNPVVVDSVVPPTQQLAAGEVPIVAPNVLTVVTPLQDEGAPIEFVAPDLTTGNEFVTMLSEGSDSPEAARCFFDFLFTEEGQLAYNGPTSVSPIESIEGSAELPANYIAPRIEELPEHEEELLGLLGLG